MTTASLPITYTGSGPSEALRVGLEQQRVVGNRLTTLDLMRMLSIINSGGSARTYTPANCPASVVGDTVVVPLVFWCWPMPLDLPYGLTANQGTISAPVAVQMEREFDLIVDFASSIELPFACTSLDYTWSVTMPCFDRASNIVDPPTVTVSPGRLAFDRQVLGVLSLRCVAVGYRHSLTLTIPKGTDRITDVTANVVASWMDGATVQTTVLSLDIPGCVEQLLETCPDGSLVHDVGGIEDPEQKIPVVYYDECTGRVLEVRYELP